MTASIEIQHLAQQWAEDRDSLSDESLEALYAWVRDLVWHTAVTIRSELGVPLTEENIIAFTVLRVAGLLGGWGCWPVTFEARTLCEDAGVRS